MLVFLISHAAWVLNRLPKSIFHILHNLLYFRLKITQYRKTIIIQNLNFLFPNLPFEQKEKIINRFYHFFSGMLLQTLQNFDSKPINSQKNILVHNIEFWKSYKEKHPTSVIIALSHYSDWEILSAHHEFLEIFDRKAVALYAKIKNKQIDALLRSSREKKGARFVSGREIPKALLEGKNEPTCYFFLCDQYPAKNQAAEEVRFFNKKIRFLSGPERYARKLNYPVIYINISPEKNNQYEINAYEITGKPSETKPGEITQLIAAHLEKQISEDPSLWLLSHKRFKDCIQYI